MAETLLRDTLHRFPDAEPIRIKLASVLLSQGQLEEAESFLSGAAKSEVPTSAEYIAMWNEPITRAKLRHAEGRSNEAIKILTEAERRFPHIWALRAHHARILDEISGPETAIAVVEEYMDAHWWCYPGSMLLGGLRTKIGDIEGAIEAFCKASMLDIHAAAPYVAIAEIQAACGNLEATEAAIGEALRRDPSAATATRLFQRVAAAAAQK